MVCGGQHKRKDPNRVLVTQARVDSEAKVFGLTRHLRVPCENLMIGLKLLANLQTGADNLVDTIFDGLQEQSRLNITNEPRRFIEVDNQAVKIGDLAKNSEAIKLSGASSIRGIYQNPAVWEKVDDLTLR